jgi:hypothetical protein
MKRARIHYGKRYSVKLGFPPEGILNVAHNRTEGMVGYFLDVGHREPMAWQEQLRRLCASCYIQGINDAIDVEVKRRERDEL